MAKTRKPDPGKRINNSSGADTRGEAADMVRAAQVDANGGARSTLFDSRLVRGLISAGLIFYLAVLFLGPLANPISSDFLTRPLAELVSPIHRVLFLGHGYRFFGPDPGPGHLVVYRVTDREGNVLERHFPDRESTWPRLMYHRWFMLSETIFNEHAMTPDEKSFRQTEVELGEQVKELKKNGKFALSERIARERSKMANQYHDARRRIDELVSSLAGYLLQIHEGTHVELFVQERALPFTVQILTGTKIDDPKFLSTLTKIGEFRLDEQGRVVSLELPDPKREGER